MDPIARLLAAWLPESLAVQLNRWKAVLLGALFYQVNMLKIQLKCSYFHYSLICQYCTRYPDSAKRLIKGGMYNEVKSVMSKEEFEKHFR